MDATTTRTPSPPRPRFEPLGELENWRAVDRIERAERDTPFCMCGTANAAVARGDTIWLECSSLREPRTGVGGIVARLSGGWGHTRHVIMELPRAA